MEDKFGRKIEYARISVTDLCNLRCAYCMPDGVEKKSHKDIMRIEEIEAVSDALANLGVKKQRLTGGEPLARKGIISLAEHMGANEKIETLAITTNGILLTKFARDLVSCGVRAVNVSIDTLDKNKYERLTRLGNIDDAKRGIDSALDAGFEMVKLNAVLLKGVNDDEIYALASFARGLGVEMRFIELMPFEKQCGYANRYFISTNDIVKTLNLRKCDKIENGDKAVEYAFDDGVRVKFISPLTSKFCASCNRVRITADGKMLNCLHENKTYELREYIGDIKTLENKIESCVLQKPECHKMNEGVLQKREMEDIGG